MLTRLPRLGSVAVPWPEEEYWPPGLESEPVCTGEIAADVATGAEGPAAGAAALAGDVGGGGGGGTPANELADTFIWVSNCRNRDSAVGSC